MAPKIQSWLLQQMNAHDSLDGVAVTIKLAVREFGSKRVARELKRLVTRLERDGKLPGWQFPGS